MEAEEGTVSAPSKSVLVATVALGALAAGIAFLLYRLTHGGRQAPSLKELQRQLELLRQGAEEAHQELTEGLSRGAEAWIADVKDALMTKHAGGNV